MSARILIAGGGMVGISLALHLARDCPAEAEITLVESVPLTGGRADYHPSFDARSTALSRGSRLLYEALGVWPALARHAAPIEHIHVSRGGRFGSSALHAAEYGWPALGHVIENAWLGRTLLDALLATPRVRLCSPASAVAARPAGGCMQVSLDAGETLSTDLLVIADGARSRLRDSLGLGASEKPYGQHALVANVAFARDHGGVAYERFTDSGPLALLPLPATGEAPHRAGLVWTLPEDSAEALAVAAPAAFLAALQRAFGYRLGRFTRVGERVTYPLSLLEVREPLRRHAVVIGNAAHALHPVAGQGFNLALRDVAALSSVLSAALREGEAPGSPQVLSRYAQRQAADQRRTIVASDALPRLFMHPNPVLALLRDLALSGLDIAPAAKGLFVRYAAGLASREVESA
jgi:2-octaprenyl-6-methoxyphenol hydroxylase